jgi:hypothetical protein
MRIPSVILCCSLLALAACSSSQSGKSEADSTASAPKKPVTEAPARSMNLDSLAALRRMHSPNVFRIVGTVVSIEPPGAEGATTGPCAKAPCMASIRIDSLFYHDSTAAYPFTVGQTVRMRFVYTLAPSRDLFPKAGPDYPGLKTGSAFEADVMRSRPRGASGNEGAFMIAAYTAR